MTSESPGTAAGGRQAPAWDRQPGRTGLRARRQGTAIRRCPGCPESLHDFLTKGPVSILPGPRGSRSPSCQVVEGTISSGVGNKGTECGAPNSQALGFPRMKLWARLRSAGDHQPGSGRSCCFCCGLLILRGPAPCALGDRGGRLSPLCKPEEGRGKEHFRRRGCPSAEHLAFKAPGREVNPLQRTRWVALGSWMGC